MLDFEAIIDRLINAIGLKNQSELSTAMGVHRSVFSNWKSRNSIPFEHIIALCMRYNISLDFIFLGQNLHYIYCENSIKGRLFDKINNSSQNHFYLEIVLFSTILGLGYFDNTTPESQKNKTDLIEIIRDFNAHNFALKLISKQNKDNLIAFILELTDEEVRYILNNKDDFLIHLKRYINFAKKFYILKKTPSVSDRQWLCDFPIEPYLSNDKSDEKQ